MDYLTEFADRNGHIRGLSLLAQTLDQLVCPTQMAY